MGSQVHTKFQRNRPNRYRETSKRNIYGKGVRTCARADALHL